MLGKITDLLNRRGGDDPADAADAQRLEDLKVIDEVWRDVANRSEVASPQTVNVRTVTTSATPVRNQTPPANQSPPAKKPATEKPATEDRIKLAKKRKPGGLEQMFDTADDLIPQISLPPLLLTSAAMLILSLSLLLIVAAIPGVSMRLYYTTWSLLCIMSAGIGYVGVRSARPSRRSLFLEMALGLCWPFAIPAVIAQFLPSLG